MYRQFIAGLCVVLIHSQVYAAGPCDEVYQQFKDYREQVNKAVNLEQLTPYFSSRFNRYYTEKLAQNAGSQRYLTHYWDNLNTAKDIVIVYDYKVSCPQEDQAELTLLVILNEPAVAPQTQLDLWKVTVYYALEAEEWLIKSFEYQKSRSQRTFTESEIIDNFALVR